MNSKKIEYRSLIIVRARGELPQHRSSSENPLERAADDGEDELDPSNRLAAAAERVPPERIETCGFAVLCEPSVFRTT